LPCISGARQRARNAWQSLCRAFFSETHSKGHTVPFCTVKNLYRAFFVARTVKALCRAVFSARQTKYITLKKESTFLCRVCLAHDKQIIQTIKKLPQPIAGRPTTTSAASHIITVDRNHHHPSPQPPGPPPPPVHEEGEKMRSKT
jgi:hypothetical protein